MAVAGWWELVVGGQVGRRPVAMAGEWEVVAVKVGGKKQQAGRWEGVQGPHH